MAGRANINSMAVSGTLTAPAMSGADRSRYTPDEWIAMFNGIAMFNAVSADGKGNDIGTGIDAYAYYCEDLFDDVLAALERQKEAMND